MYTVTSQRLLKITSVGKITMFVNVISTSVVINMYKSLLFFINVYKRYCDCEYTNLWKARNSHPAVLLSAESLHCNGL